MSILNFRAGGAEPAAEPSARCKRRPVKVRAGFRFEARKASHLNKLEHFFACPPLHLHGGVVCSTQGPEARRSGCWVAPPPLPLRGRRFDKRDLPDLPRWRRQLQLPHGSSRLLFPPRQLRVNEALMDGQKFGVQRFG